VKIMIDAGLLLGVLALAVTSFDVGLTIGLAM
jgi:hypothetical protein